MAFSEWSVGGSEVVDNSCAPHSVQVATTVSLEGADYTVQYPGQPGRGSTHYLGQGQFSGQGLIQGRGHPGQGHIQVRGT